MHKQPSTAFIITMIAIVILSSFASAELIVNKYTNDFSIESPANEQVKMCSCETKIDTIVVDNVGQFGADFEVRVETNYPGSIKVSPSTFTLAPKHLREILVYIDDSCGIYGTFQYDVVVSNSYGRIERMHRTIRSDQCQTARLKIAPEGVMTGLCQSATFEVTTTNVGPYTDAFTLSFGAYEYATQAPIPSMLLEPGQSYTQEVAMTFPCEEYGTRIIPITVVAEKGGSTSSTERTVTIQNEYEFSLDIPTRIDVCANINTEIPVKITNEASVKDNILVHANGPLFAKLSSREPISIAGESEKNVSVLLQPSQSDIGSHRLIISAQDMIGGKKKERSTEIIVHQCVDLDLKIQRDETTDLRTPLTACCGEETLFVNVQNNGDRETVVQLLIDGPSIFQLEETSLRLAPGQNTNVLLTASLPCTDQAYSATIIAIPQGMEHLNTSSTVSIHSQTERTCHAISIDEDELLMKETTTSLPIIIRNSGVAGGTYNIALENNLFSIEEESITLEPGEETTIHLIPRTNLFDEEKGRYVINPTITFEDPRITYEESVGISLVARGPIEQFNSWVGGLPWNSLGVCGWTIIILSAILCMGIVILILTYLGILTLWKDGLTAQVLSIIKTALIVAIIVMLVILLLAPMPTKTAFYERAIDGSDTSILELYQGDEKTIDLNQYFSDPDQDTLEYSAEQPKNVRVHIEENLLTIIPDKGFFGEDSLRIIATDPGGKTATSPRIQINVIPAKDLGVIGTMHLWCVQLITLLIFGILLVMTLLAFTIKERRPNSFQRKNIILVVPKDRQEKRAISATKKTKTSQKNSKIAKNAGKDRKKTRKEKTTAKAPSKSRKNIQKKTTARKSSPNQEIKKVSSKVSTIAPVRIRNLAEARSGTPLAMERITGPGSATVNIAVGQPAPPPIITVPGARQNEIVYVGAKEGNTVHTPHCAVARRIPKNKRIAYSTKHEAVSAGLVPCRLCRPFEGGI